MENKTMSIFFRGKEYHVDLTFLIDQRRKNIPTNKTSVQCIENVIKHISSILCYENHYCREKTQYKYLGPELDKEIMYELYVQFCKENNIYEDL